MTSSEATPRVVGRYVICDEIAAGGMATVHVGRLMGVVGFARTVAIKRLHPHIARDPEFVSMFLDEARMVARIQHPNVVPTLDVVALAGELLIVMEYVQGESLSRLFRAARTARTPVPIPVLCSVLVALLHGLHAAHEATNERGEPLGIVHRDVSPQNVLVGGDGVTRVVDFGVAKARGRLQDTREGVVKGKPAYMAPEHLRGDPVDRRSDVYAVGVVAWEGVTGRRLFTADNEHALAIKVIEAKVPSLKATDPRTPDALDAIVMKSLKASPDDRFASAKEMAIAIERALPLATATEVQAWVEGLASEVLRQRREMISRVESQSDFSAGVTDADLPVPRSTATPPSASAPTQEERWETRSQTSTSLSTEPDPPVRGRDARGWGALGLVAAVVVGLSVLGLSAFGLSKMVAPAADKSPASPPPPTSATTSASAGPVVAPPVTTASVSAATKETGAAPSATRSKTPKTAPRVSNCSPPYTVDAQGLHHMKPECL